MSSEGGAGARSEEWRGEVFTVVVAGLRQLRWGIVVRAADEGDARAIVESRGHQVRLIRRGQTAGPAATKLTLGACVDCGYSLLRLPVGADGAVMCPECGTINAPTAPLERRLQIIKQRRSRLRLLSYGWAAIFALLVLLIALLRG
jgi:phage FluMu protein Com